MMERQEISLFAGKGCVQKSFSPLGIESERLVTDGELKIRKKNWCERLGCKGTERISERDFKTQPCSSGCIRMKNDLERTE